MPLQPWQTFFFLIGSSGAALTGLQFVVIALIAESRKKTTTREIEAFGTPTIVHFVSVLLVCAILSAPWEQLTPVAVILGALGLAGVFYVLIVLRRARGQKTYRVVAEDWTWHVVLPLLAYALLLVSAILLRSAAPKVLFGFGASVLLLLLIGIHNSWDTVTFITIEASNKKK